MNPATVYLSVSWTVREFILNEDMKNFTSNMNMTQRMFDGFLNANWACSVLSRRITIW